MKLALFRSPNISKPVACDELTEKHCPEYVRISEYVNVDFPPLSLEAKQEQLARLEGARDNVRQFYETQLKRLDEQAQALAS